MSEPMFEEPNAMDPNEAIKPRLHCFNNVDRVCGPDCMAFLTTPPRGQDYVEKAWAHCHVLVTQHQMGKHLVILANVASRGTSAEPLPAPPVPR